MVDFFEEMNSRGIDLKVYFQARHHSERPWAPQIELDFPHEFLSGKAMHIGRRIVHLNYGVERLMDSTRSSKDLWILSGFLSPAFQILARRLNREPVPWILLNEAPYKSVNSFSPRDMVRQLALMPVRGAEGVLVFGASRDRSYFLNRLSEKPVIAIPQLFNASDFRKIAESRRSRDPASTDNKIRILYCGQWEISKRVDLLFETAVELVGEHWSIEFCFVGNGSLAEKFRAQLASKGIDRVELKCCLDRQALLQEYANADLFVQPTRNQGWGMGVTEALAAGLPVIASSGVGAAKELITSGQEGFLFEPDDFEMVDILIRKLIKNRQLLDAMTKYAIAKGDQISIKYGVDQFLDAVQSILSSVQEVANL